MEKKKTSPLYKVIKWLVWLFSPKFKVEGAENLPEGACIVVGNHSHMYGPIACELYTPGQHETWCTGEMFHKEEVAEYAFNDFWSGKPKATHWFYRILSHLITPLSVLIFNNADTIPVYRDTRLYGTFRQSITALEEGKRVVIFPECYDPHNNIVYSFQKEFVDLARMVYRKTGEEISFVPLYVCPKLKKMVYGPPVKFHGGAEIGGERERVCGELMDGITGIALSLPKHKVVPYPNVSKRYFKYNIPLEVYDGKTEETVI